MVFSEEGRNSSSRLGEGRCGPDDGAHNDCGAGAQFVDVIGRGLERETLHGATVAIGEDVEMGGLAVGGGGYGAQDQFAIDRKHIGILEMKAVGVGKIAYDGDEPGEV